MSTIFKRSSLVIASIMFCISMLSACGSTATVKQATGDARIVDDVTKLSDEEGESEMIDKIDVFTQSSIRIESSQGTIYFDPYEMTEEPHDADFIFLTHDHYDHYSPEDIAKVIGGHTTIIAPEKMADTVATDVSGYEDIVAVSVGITKSVNGLEFETVASYNQIKPFHPKSAGWVGYIVSVDGQQVYVAGDTDATKEAKQVKCDIALIPIGGTYTMDAKKAAELINEIKPIYAVPTHYGSVVGKPEDADTFENMVKEPVKVVKKIRF